MGIDVKKAVVVGGSGFVGGAVVKALMVDHAVTIVDKVIPKGFKDYKKFGLVEFIRCDLLHEEIHIPEGDVYLVHGSGETTVRREYLQIARNVLTTARLLPYLSGRRVVLVSSVEVYGAYAGVMNEEAAPSLPLTETELQQWSYKAIDYAKEPTPEWSCQPWCNELIEDIDDARWVYGVSKRLQELLLESSLEKENLTIFRLANVIGAGQVRVVSKFIHAARNNLPLRVSENTLRTFVSIDRVCLAVISPVGCGVFNVGGEKVHLVELAKQVKEILGSASPLEVFSGNKNDSSGLVDDAKLVSKVGPASSWPLVLEGALRDIVDFQGPIFYPSIPVVIPPRPEDTATLTDRFQRALYTGMLKHGAMYTTELEARLTRILKLPDTSRIIATKSGTAALHLCYEALGSSANNSKAVVALPSFTFAATAESLKQRGYSLRFVDVKPNTWTMDPTALEELLESEQIDLVVSVDALGNPIDYDSVVQVCQKYRVPLVADSAPALGALYKGVPVGSQANYHAFSMSFAKTISSGGNGGFLVLPKACDLSLGHNLLRSQTMTEINAAVALDQLDHYETIIQRRIDVANIYEQASVRWGAKSQLAEVNSQNCFVHWGVVFDAHGKNSRDQIAKELEHLGVSTKPYYDPALHLTQLADAGQASLPVTESLNRNCLALPMSSEMTFEDAHRVVMAMDRVLLG